MSEQQIQDYDFEENMTAEELEMERKRREKRAERIQQMKKEKERYILIQNCIKIAVPIIAVALIAVIIITKVSKGSDENDIGQNQGEVQIADGSFGNDEVLNKESQSGKGNQENIISQGNTDNQSNATSQGNTDTQGNAAFQGSVGTQGNTSSQNNTNTQGNATDSTGTLNNTTGQNSGTLAQSNEKGQNYLNSQPKYSATTTSTTKNLSSEIISTNALLIDLESGNILAKKDMNTVLSPASMTKVLTVLVAAEQIEQSQLDDTFTMTIDITDYAYVNDCSSVGFLVDEVVTVRDLFYGTILPSGGDAAVGLATYVAGSHEAFVELMNEKLEELGLADTAHVTNCVGLYDKEHHCTVYDMAMIMEAAMENEICREVMNAHTYTTSPTTEHPEGITISNWFLRRIEDKDTGGEVLCAKTGFVNQSGSCAVSYARDNGGKEYICVTANSTSSWKCIYDHVAIYKMFATGEPEENTVE